MATSPLLELKNIKTHYSSKSRSGLFTKKTLITKAVNDVSLCISKGESIGLVGESGCGKSTLAKSILRLAPMSSGKIIFDNKDISSINEKEFKKLRKDLQIIFQDPYSSLNPRMTVKQIITEPLIEHNIFPRNKIFGELINLMHLVGLSPKLINKFPHEFSGGQRQRVAIARALALKPKLLIADEPVSALDVSIQAQILNLIKDLQKKMNLSLLFISHNLAVVKYICPKIAVMKSGKIIEYGNRHDIFKNSKHPYTKSLIQAIPSPFPHKFE
ncbi:MAG: ABC transporter ATP-binding protein [bacterium]|nr:ABC transporter ATP-binding protein [bacterium]